MSQLRQFVTSSIGRKQIVALTGLLMIGFLIAHLAGNLLVFEGPEAFNHYSHSLITNPLIYVAEALLLVTFLTHMFFAARLTLDNRGARGPVGYAMVRSRGRPTRRTLASQTMLYSGLLAFCFLVLHLMTFKFNVDVARFQVAPVKYETVAGVAMRDLHLRVIEVFHEPAYIAWYCFSMVVLGLHLSHGAWSLVETFGIDHPRWTPGIILGGRLFAWAVAGGFASIPILVLLNVAGARR